MKTTATPAPEFTIPSDDDIRAYAYHLYEQSGCIPGRDLDNWLEAQACLLACVPVAASHARLHHHLSRQPARSPATTATITELPPAPAARPRKDRDTHQAIAPGVSVQIPDRLLLGSNRGSRP